jgi:hypothetical protein
MPVQPWVLHDSWEPAAQDPLVSLVSVAALVLSCKLVCLFALLLAGQPLSPKAFARSVHSDAFELPSVDDLEVAAAAAAAAMQAMQELQQQKVTCAP